MITEKNQQSIFFVDFVKSFLLQQYHNYIAQECDNFDYCTKKLEISTRQIQNVVEIDTILFIVKRH